MAVHTKSERMRAQYAAWPYPHVPLLARLPSSHPFELHAAWLWDRCGSGPAPARPRIWIAGCGTFQPYAFAVANPGAEIHASDISEPSLRIAARRCALHRQRHVTFSTVDLGDESTWPDGPFDVIECYGVLMNLADPARALRGLRERLSPRGVLRLMVYPRWSRARVFQLQRLAHLLGFTATERHHPAAFRSLVRTLPRAHPLRFAFTTYQDSRNDAGVVDAFLHAGDRGFTAFELGDLLVGAGLVPEHWFHRPWGRPEGMAQRLGLENRTQTFVLGYLDLWQELRSNFVVCARRDDAPTRESHGPMPHPTFVADGQPLRHRLHLERLRWFGGRLPSRTTDAPVVLTAGDARALARGETPAHLRESGLVLGGADDATAPTLRPHEPWPAEPTFLRHTTSLRVGRRAPNPLYAHLFAAFELAARHPELALPDLETQVGRWLPWADPLEERPIRFGLTPYGTFQRLRQNVLEHLSRSELPTAASWADVRLRNDAAALQQVRDWRRDHTEAPTSSLDDAALRELHVLLFSFDSLFVTLE